MKKNSFNLYAFAIQDQLSQGLTGQTPTIQISKDGGSFAATTNSATEFNASTAPGLYTITFTATECDCDVMIIQVYLPNGQDPAILAVEEMQSASGGGATPQQIWEYAGGRTVTNTIPTAQNIWEYSSRTLTASALTAQQVWEYSGGRTLTASPTDISGLATSSALSAVATNVSAVKAKTDNLPQAPAAVGSEMTLTNAAISAVQNGLSTFNPTNDTVTLNATEDGTLTAIKTKVDTLTNTDLTGIATSTDVSNAQTAIIARGNEAWITATGFTVPDDLLGLATKEGLVYNLNLLTQHGNTYWITASGFATPSDIPTDYAKPTDIPTSDITAIKTKVDSLHNTDLSGVATALSVEKIHAGLFNWTLDEDVINAKNTSGTVIVSSTITRDSSGNITAMEEGND